MKAWEKINGLAEGKLDFDSIDKVKSWMYSNRCIPCDIEDEFHIMGKNVMAPLCVKHQLDCYPCMEEYLQLEVENQEMLKESE